MQLQPEYQNILNEWIEITQTIHDEMMADEVEDGTAVDMTYAFSSPTQEPLEALQKALSEALEYETMIDFLPEDGDEPAVFVLYGQTGAVDGYVDTLNTLLGKMVGLGAQNQAKFEYWEARLANEEAFEFGIGSFDNSDSEDIANFPKLLHLKVFKEIPPIERGEEYEEPLIDFLQEHNLGVIGRSGSLCHLDDEGLELDGFEVIICVANPTEAIRKIEEFFATLISKKHFSLEAIEEDSVVEI